MNLLIEKALQFAAVKHAGQVRKGTNIPYITHPFGVALLLLEENSSEEVVAAGLLHDTLEDTDTTEDEIADAFGETILNLVKAASEPDKSLSWEERKRHTIQDLPLRSASELAVIVADKLHNLRSIQKDVEKDGEEVWTRFNRGKRDQSWYYMSIVHSLKYKKREVPLLKKFEKEVFKLFVGREKLLQADIDLLLSCVYMIGESERMELQEKGFEKFADEISVYSEAKYRSGDFREEIDPIGSYLEGKGVQFQSNSDGPFILLTYVAELKHRLAWTDELLYKHFYRNRSKL